MASRTKKVPELFPEGWGQQEFTQAATSADGTLKPQEGGLQLSARPRRISLADVRRLAKKAPSFIPDPNQKGSARVKLAKPKDPKAGTGILAAIEVSAKVRYLRGLLLMDLSGIEDGGVDLRSTRVFRWDDESAAYQLVDDSGIHERVVWANITGAGHYVLAASPRHPVALVAARLLSELRPLLSSVKRPVAARIRKELLASLADISNSADPAELWSAVTADSMFRGIAPPPSYQPGRSTGTVSTQNLADATIDQQLATQARFDRWYFSQPWELVGPTNVAGRVGQLAIAPATDTRIFAATDGGGVWVGYEWRPRGPAVAVQPEEEGWTGWQPLTDTQPVNVFTAIAIDPSRPATIWAAADSTGRILRSDDNGIHWRTLSLPNYGWVRTILPEPTDSNSAIIASQNGLYRTTSTAAILSGDVLDAAFDRTTPNIIFAAVRNRGVVKTTNGARDWVDILPWSRATTPSSSMIKIAISLGDDRTRTVVAKLAEEVFVHRQGGDRPSAGSGWVARGRLGIDHGQGRSGQGDWCHVMAIDPFDPDHFLGGQQDLQVTTNGGRDWRWVAGYKVVDNVGIGHPDQQHVLFDPVQRGRVYAASDGGVHISRDGGETWTDYNDNLACTSAYRIGVSGGEATSGVYHHGLVVTRDLGGSTDWLNYGGGAWEFLSVEGDPSRPGRFYFLGPFAEYHNRPQPPWPFDINGDFARFSVHDVAIPQRTGVQALLAADSATGEIKRTLNGDLHSPTWAVEPGIPSTEHIVAFAHAIARPGMATDPTVLNWCYAAARSGRVYYKQDILSGRPWVLKGRWDGSTGDPRDPSRTATDIIAMAVNQLHPERVYLLTSDKVARSINSGADWAVTNGSGSIRIPMNCHTLLAHPTDGRTLYVGAQGLGNAFVSHDEGDTWQSLRDNLPTVSVETLIIENGWLYASTYGRAMWRRRIAG